MVLIHDVLELRAREFESQGEKKVWGTDPSSSHYPYDRSVSFKSRFIGLSRTRKHLMRLFVCQFYHTTSKKIATNRNVNYRWMIGAN